MVMTQPNSHAGPSSSANRSQTMSPRSALPTEPTHVQAIHDFDPTQLASTSASNMNMYLAFYAGEILRVHVRDATGWWDGEIASVNDTGDPEPRKGPRRGWFPSNYVREMGWVWPAHRKTDSTTSHTSSAQSPIEPIHPHLAVEPRHKTALSQASQASHASQTSQISQSSTTGITSPVTSQARSSSRQSTGRSPSSRTRPLPPSLQALLHPVVQCLSLLETAIHTNRKTHFQPSAACVISSIRAVLSQTDCLSKHSEVLAKFPLLGKERKAILVELSKLVNCAKAASGLHAEGAEASRTEDDEDRDMEDLAKSARAVFAGVKRFLNLAGTFGVEAVAVADADESIPPFLTTTEATPGPSAPRTPSGGNARIQETFKKRAASIGDLRAARRRQSSPPPPMPSTAGLDTSFSSQISRSRSPSVTTPLSASFTSTTSGRSSPMSAKQYRGGRRVQGSMDSAFSQAASSDGGDGHELSPYLQNPTLLHTPQMGNRVVPDVSEQINLAEDSLLSIIAAFIGHIHSHHIGSHPSSHATLIEMTRQTIDAVRELLTIVEGIGRTPTIRAVRPREVESLRQAKDQLYDVASRLVEGAEAVANAPPADQGDDNYDKDKAKLLQSATGTLRAGAECVRLVRLCTPDPSTPNHLSTPRQGDSIARHHTPRPNQEAGLVKRDYPVGQRGEHTLSGLHRKATSLSYLQQRYQQDGSMVHATPEEEEHDEDGEEDEELVADLSREEDVTVKPLQHLAPPLPVRVPTTRPTLSHIHTAPLGVPTTAHPAELVRTHSEGTPIPRSRSSSLSSPAPPRLQRRSPSRSVDLDKIASDNETPKEIRREPSTVSGSVTVRPSLVTAFSQMSTSTMTSASAALPSGRSSSASHRSTNADRSGGDDWNHLSQFKVEFPSMASLPKLSQLRIDTDRDVAPIKGQPMSAMQLRPAANRAMTQPIHNQPDMRFWVVAHDYDPREITFNSEGTMVGASLTVLVEKMTPHDGPVDSMFWASFFYTFRLHTDPLDFTEALIRRYDIMPPSNIAMTEREQEMWVERKVVPVRLRVYNLLKAWLDTYWKPEADDVALETMREFAIEVVQPTLPAMAPRLLEAIRKRSSGPLSAGPERPGSSASSYNDHSRRSHSRTLSTDKLSLKSPLSLLSPNAITPGPASAGFSQLSSLPPTPIISKSLNTLLQKPGIELSRIPLTEFDTLELARQLTIMESKMFNQVAPEDLLLTGRRKVAGLKALSETSNQITGWIADTILAELDIKRRTGLLKFYIKLADKCLYLHNFSSMWAILAGLNSSTIMRLKKTWDSLSAKYKIMMDRLRAVIEHTKNHAAYRSRLREVAGPCLPFLGLILTDITFTFDGNSDTRQSTLSPDLSLVNHDKYAKLGKIAVEFKRYQEPFNFHALEPVQTYLRRALAERGSASIDALYRKSLLLEPRQGQERVSVFVERPGWLGGKI